MKISPSFAGMSRWRAKAAVKLATRGPRDLGVGSLVTHLTAPRWLMLACCFIVFFLGIVNLDIVLHHEGAFAGDTTTPLGGDFIAFYNAGRIVAAGDGGQLYDWGRQVTEQAHTLGVDAVDTVMPFPYPAFVAAPYALLAPLPFAWAYVVATLAMLAAAVGAVMLLRPVSPTVREQPLLVTLVVLASQPLVQVIYGGQTVAFSLLCFAGSYAALRKEREVAAGLWLGLLLYKPQLVAPLLALLLWRGHWRAVATAGVVGVALGAAGIAVAGPDWPRAMLTLVGSSEYAAQEQLNGAQMISLMGVAEQLFGMKSAPAYGVAGVLGLVAVALLVRSWRGANASGLRFPLQFGLAIVVTLLVSPHALYYEAGLLVLPALALVDHWRFESHSADVPRPTSAQRLILVGLFLAGHLRFFVPTGPVELFAAFAFVIGLLLWQALRADGATAPSTAQRALPSAPPLPQPFPAAPDRA